MGGGSLGIFRRFHPVRFIRFCVFLMFLVILVTSAWRYFVPSTRTVERALEPEDINYELSDLTDNIVDHRSTYSGLKWSFGETKDRRGHGHVGDHSGQALLDYIGTYLDVRYVVVGNERGRYYVDLVLTNKGSGTVEPCCWAIYFYHMKFIDTNPFNAGVPMLMIEERSHNTKTEEDVIFTITHVNGYTFRLQPTNRFVGLETGEGVTLRIVGGGWAISRSEVVPNWYVANDYEPTEPRLLQSTVGEELKFVQNFDMTKKWVRSDEDICLPFGPEQRYARNKVHDLGREPLGILPTPLKVEFRRDTKRLVIDGRKWTIQYVEGLENEARYLQEKLNISSLKLVDIPMTTGKAQCLTNSITIHLSDNMPKNISTLASAEKYVLVVGAKRGCISIFSPSSAGVFYGAVSLVSLAVANGDGTSSFTGAIVVDAPRYEYRGVMVDVVRHFHAKTDLVRLMDVMALYKLNRLHLHLADDEGWRLEIKGLEELTSVGGQRGHDLGEKSCLMAMIGSGPFTNSSGCGFYTRSDYLEILHYARSRHIEVIPEFDMPGHSHAAIKSMEARYARLKAIGREEEGLRYLLSDLADRSVYTSGQFFKDSAINPCIESSYRFVEHVVQEVIELHKGVMPLKVLHFGGDEVPQEAYTASPACAKFLQHHSQLVSTKDLKTYFVRRVAHIVARLGLTAMGWEDAFSMYNGQPITVADLSAKDVISQAWYNIWESGLAHRAYQYANSGYKVVLSPTTNFYYDNPQEPDPEDWGLHWATRYINTKRSFNFMPESIYDSIDFDFWGRPITKSDLCDMNRILCDPLRLSQNIIGIEAVMWSELIRTPDRLDSMLWPRLLALAERSWHKANWETIGSPAQRLAVRKEDWSNFANTVGYKELRRLESYGVKYYIPRPGARVRKGKLWVNTAFPGLVVQVSADEGLNWNDYDINAKYKGHLLLATRSFDSTRRSVPVAIDIGVSYL